MQKQFQAPPGSNGSPESLKGDAKAKLAASKGQSALADIDRLLAQEVEREQEQEPVRSSCACW